MSNWQNTGFHGMVTGFANNPVRNRKAVTQNMIATHLIELCANRFEWYGLPDSVDPRFLELTLMQRALSVFFRDEGPKEQGFTNTGEFFVLPAAGGGLLNVQDVPTHFQVTAQNALLNVRLKATGDQRECVPIWANYLRRPELDKIALFSQKLAEIDRTIEIAEMNLRRTRIVKVPENKRLTYQNIMRQHEEGEPVIYGSDTLNTDDAIESLDISSDPGAVSTLWDAKNQRWNECMTMLGINNANQDKKERLVAAEVGANDEQVSATRNIALNARQYACEQINKRWPELNVWVEFRMDSVDMDGDGDTDQGDKEIVRGEANKEVEA